MATFSVFPLLKHSAIQNLTCILQAGAICSKHYPLVLWYFLSSIKVKSHLNSFTTSDEDLKFTKLVRSWKTSFSWHEILPFIFMCVKIAFLCTLPPLPSALKLCLHSASHRDKKDGNPDSKPIWVHLWRGAHFQLLAASFFKQQPWSRSK